MTEGWAAFPSAGGLIKRRTTFAGSQIRPLLTNASCAQPNMQVCVPADAWRRPFSPLLTPWLRSASDWRNGGEEGFCFLCTALTSSSAISLHFPHLSRRLIFSTVSAVGCLSGFDRASVCSVAVPTMPLHLLPGVSPLFHQPSLPNPPFLSVT